uniref:Ribosomal protein L6 n=1 Tax=Ministeria vibrans TaxID=134558 RepID=M1KFL5_MINVI|nr:ribosomal protein L6 [Ministeria vibrans]AGE93700.1 ribosomal protein L6 [Ministeria vibrans]
MNQHINYKLIFIKNHTSYQRPIEKDLVIYNQIQINKKELINHNNHNQTNQTNKTNKTKISNDDEIKGRLYWIEKEGRYKYDKDTEKLNKETKNYTYMYNLKWPIQSLQRKGQDLMSGNKTVLIRIKGTGNKFYLIKDNKGQKLKIKAGKSHPFLLKIAKDINLFPISRNQIIIEAKNKDRVARLVNILKKIKRPDKYKDKGIHIN